MTTLSDREIAAEMNAGRLISNGDHARLAGACYELRMGEVYYDLTESDRPISLAAGENVLIKPGHRIVLITFEELLVPNDVLVRVVSKGSLFSIGLSPIATYADPGFSGKLGIVTQNISDKYILLPALEPIAKAEFTKLSGSAAKPYGGQHGFQTNIWPIKHQLQKTYSEISEYPRVASEKKEAFKLLPSPTRRVIENLERRQSFMDAAILVAVFVNSLLIFLANGQFIGSVLGILGNLLCSAVTAYIAYYTKRVDA